MTWDYDRILPTTKAILLRNGWSPDRRVSTVAYRDANGELGTKLHVAGEQFLQNVGGLSLKFPHFANPLVDCDCNFDPVSACDLAKIDQIRLYEKYLGDFLCVIGEMYDRRLALMISSGGRIFAGYEYDLIAVGETPATALNNLCSGKCLPVTEVPRVSTRIDQSSSGLAPAVIRGFSDAGRDVEGSLPSAAALSAEVFCTRYGGVSIACKGADGTPDTCNLFASQGEKPWECPDETRAAIGSTAEPIGEIIGACIHLVMSNDGRVFGFLPEIASELWCYGSSGEEALNNIVLGIGGTRPAWSDGWSRPKERG